MISLTRGAWSWWISPLAVRFVASHDRIYFAFTDRTGKQYAASWDNNTRELVQTLLCEAYVADEHNAPCLVPPRSGEAGDKWLVFYTGHGGDNVIRYRSSVGHEDFSSFGSESTLTFSGTVTTYVQAHRFGQNIVLFTRIAGKKWAYMHSDDGGATWGNEVLFLDYDVGDDWLYMTSAQMVASPAIVRFAVGDHPDHGGTHNVRYGYIDLSDGSVKKVDDATIANIYTETDLPITPSDLTSVHTAGANEATRLLAIGHGTSPEILFCSFDEADPSPSTSGVYKYAVWESGVGFHVRTLIAAGLPIENATLVTYYYVAGGYFEALNTEGIIYLAREDAGAWILEKWVSSDKGANWSTSEIRRTQNPVKVYRPVAPLNKSERGKLLWVEGTYETYIDFNARIMLLPEFLPVMTKVWDSAAWEQVAVKVWDGAAWEEARENVALGVE